MIVLNDGVAFVVVIYFVDINEYDACTLAGWIIRREAT
ncbi:hypothetical protein BF49_4739 [Bradyrhizobium sp.]|nr:hypothetical protein BF49_4739 [Bradyrhizobium sp.]